MTKKSLTIFALLAALASFTACGREEAKKSAVAEKKIRIVTTVAPITSIVENVTKAEITKSGGGGFDEEALKAVRQSRFEPAQRDGHNVPAEFTYIYRFRLTK
jgi:hypothetical protein